MAILGKCIVHVIMYSNMYRSMYDLEWTLYELILFCSSFALNLCILVYDSIGFHFPFISGYTSF